MEQSDDEMMAAMLHAMAMMGAPDDSPVSDGITIGQLIEKRPDLARRLAVSDPVLTAATFGGLLTAPELQASAFRLEALVHLTLAHSKGRLAPSDKLVAELFQYLGNGYCGLMEDPAEDVFVGLIRSPWGNFRVLEGLWEGATFYLQRFVEAVASVPEGAPFDDIRRSVLALLRLSEAVCDRARLARWQLGEEVHAKTLPKRIASALPAHQGRVHFTKPELKAIGIEPGDLAPFVFDLAHRDALLDAPVRCGHSERFPLVTYRGAFDLVLPTAVTTAIRHFVIDAVTRHGLLDPFRSAVTRGYIELLSRTPLLGGKAGAPLPYAWKPDDAVAEVMMEFDEGRHIHFVFFNDPLTDLQYGGFAGVNPASASMGAELKRRIARAGEEMSRREGYKGGLSIVVACGIGRGVMIEFDRDPVPNWRFESCSAYDLVTLSWTPDFKPATLWRLLEARDRIAELGLSLRNINGLINLVAWARGLDGHLVPHGQLPDAFVDDNRPTMLMIDQNRQRGLRHEVWAGQDPCVARFIDDRWIEIRKDAAPPVPNDAAAALYADENGYWSGRPLAACLTPERTWWAGISCPPNIEGAAADEYWRLVATWLIRAAPALDSLRGLPDGPILWHVIFENTAPLLEPPNPPSTYEDARLAIGVAIDDDRRIVTTRVSEGFQKAQYHPLNIAERALVAAFVHGIALLAGHADPGSVEKAETPRIVGNDQARHQHTFVAQNFRDLVRGDLRGSPLTLRREDVALVRLGLGWSVRERGRGGLIEGKDACRTYLNTLVSHIEDALIGDLRRFERRAMLMRLLRNHELAISDRDRWRSTAAATLGLHGDDAEAMKKLVEREVRLNAVFQATRTLLEIAICECPVGDGERITPLDHALLMAKAGLLAEIGGSSDAIHWDLMRPEIKVTPLGDVHANFDFVDEIIAPHGRVLNEARINGAVESYAKYLEEPSGELSVEHRMDPIFVDAWTEQFGATFDETRAFVDFVENLGVDENRAIIAIPRSRLRGVEVAGRRLDDEVTARLVDRLTFQSRPSWRDTPVGFKDRDRQPWRFRRRLSILRRPLLQLDHSPDPTLLIAPGIVRDAFSYMHRNHHHGDFSDDQLSPKMRSWKAKVSGERGTVFAKEVAAALSRAGWTTRVEINVTKLLARGFDRDHGDVDVLAWRHDDDRVLIIECKDVQFRKTHGEIAEQLMDFRGEVRPNGKRDELRKHLDRMDVIRAHLNTVSRFTGIASFADVESHLLFRHPVPMEFALKRMAEKVTVSHLARIGAI